MQHMPGTPRTVADIAAQLTALGLRPGALVMVHASLRKVGPVAGRADGLIEAVRLAIGESGTMLMVLGAEDDHAWVNDRPEDARAALLADAEPFDARTTPASEDVGTLAEVFRRRPETVVSDHPEGRFGAAGPLAHALLDDVPWDDYFGPGSPLERLVSDGGLVLRLGADRNTVTALHHAEYECTIAPKRRVTRHRLVSTPAGPRVRTVSCLDDEQGLVDYPGEDYFEDLLTDYLADHEIRTGCVGDATAELLDAADVVDYGVRWMDAHLGPLTWSVDPRALGPQLDADLLEARKHRRVAEVDAIRSLKTALANGEAVPVAEGPYELVDGRADVPRRELTIDEVDAIIAAEVGEHHRALDEYRLLRRDTATLELQVATLERYQRKR